MIIYFEGNRPAIKVEQEAHLGLNLENAHRVRIPLLLDRTVYNRRVLTLLTIS
jgi:hypothetical protein